MLNNYIDFFHDIFEKKDGVPEFYSQIFYSRNNQILFNSIDENLNSDNFFRLKYVPDYLTLKLKQDHLFTTKKVSEVKGYSIYLNDCAHVNDYLKAQFKPKKRNAIRKYIKRLESSFNISYKIFHGEIDESEYNFIMESLRKMLDNRFEQRQGTDIYKKDWSKFQNLIIELIKAKKGSLFVIYNEDRPIAITVNYHFNDKIFFYGIPSYDIDYSAFRLGHVVIYKELEWCINNNYLVFETGRGDFEYKKQWCNYIYSFDYNLIYKKKSISAFLAFQKEYYKLKLIKFLKDKKVNMFFYKMKNMFLNQKIVKTIKKQDKFKLINIDETDGYDLSNQVKPSEESCLSIKKAINDFLYFNIEHISNIKIYVIEKNKKFLIIGKDQKQLITLLH